VVDHSYDVGSRFNYSCALRQALKAQDAILRAGNKGMYSWKNSAKGKAWAQGHGNGNGNGNNRKLQAVTTWSGPVRCLFCRLENSGTHA
jgi:hypothetical protein